MYVLGTDEELYKFPFISHTGREFITEPREQGMITLLSPSIRTIFLGPVIINSGSVNPLETMIKFPAIKNVLNSVKIY